MSNKISYATLPEGFVVKIGGTPFELTEPTVVRGTLGNFQDLEARGYMPEDYELEVTSTYFPGTEPVKISVQEGHTKDPKFAEDSAEAKVKRAVGAWPFPTGPAK